MSIVENSAGVGLGIKLINGKIKPKTGVSSIIATIFFLALFVCFALAFFYGIIPLNPEFIIMPARNYYITFQSDDSLDGFELLYKKKIVNILYKTDAKGKIAYADNANKIKCVSYADGSKMSNITKYRIVNYFGKWLMENDLLSDEVTFTTS